MQKVFLLIPSFVFAVGVEYYSFVFYKVGRPYYRTENAVYGVVHRLSAMMPFACLICISLVSGLGKQLDRMPSSFFQLLNFEYYVS